MKKFLLLVVFVLTLGCGSSYAQNVPEIRLDSNASSGLVIRSAYERNPVRGYGTDSVQQPIPSSTPPQEVSDELKTQAQILSELKVQRAVNSEKDNQINALKGQIGAQSQAITFLTEQRDFYKQAASERKQAGTLDDQNILLLRQQIADDRQEIKELRTENDKLRDSRDKRALFSFGGGLLLGTLAHK